MTTGDDLAAALKANPQDDGLRLILADWAADHGDHAYEAALRGPLAAERVGLWAGWRVWGGEHPPPDLRTYLVWAANEDSKLVFTGPVEVGGGGVPIGFEYLASYVEGDGFKPICYLRWVADRTFWPYKRA